MLSYCKWLVCRRMLRKSCQTVNDLKKSIEKESAAHIGQNCPIYAAHYRQVLMKTCFCFFIGIIE